MRLIHINKGNISTKMLENNAIQEVVKNRPDKLTDTIRSTFIDINSYEKLVKEVAELSYLNQDYMLFFRGQNKNYQPNKLTTLYPSLYRGRLIKEELDYRVDVLEIASNMLKEYLKDLNAKKSVIGIGEILRINKIQWSILQHYEVCDTPLLDITHSLRVACSFAQLGCEDDYCFIYILAMPYLTGRISINSEHDLTNIRLLSISPPQALRPYFQEGYLACTEYVFDDYEGKTELDFNRRVLGIYRIPNSKQFWGSYFEKYNEDLLFPQKDEVREICAEIKKNINDKLLVNNKKAGSFLMNWGKLESWVRNISDNNYSFQSGIKYLKHNENVQDLDISINQIDELRTFRNKLVHNPMSVSLNEVNKSNALLMNLISQLKL